MKPTQRRHPRLFYANNPPVPPQSALCEAIAAPEPHYPNHALFFRRPRPRFRRQGADPRSHTVPARHRRCSAGPRRHRCLRRAPRTPQHRHHPALPARRTRGLHQRLQLPHARLRPPRRRRTGRTRSLPGAAPGRAEGLHRHAHRTRRRGASPPRLRTLPGPTARRRHHQHLHARRAHRPARADEPRPHPRQPNLRRRC